MNLPWNLKRSICAVCALLLETGLGPGSLAAERAVLVSGPAELVHDGRSWGDFSLVVDGVPMARSSVDSTLLIRQDGILHRYFLQTFEVEVLVRDGILVESVRFEDRSDGSWTVIREIAVGAVSGLFEIETSLHCNLPRDVIGFTWLTLYPGLGSFGSGKEQALFAGLEYLGNEPSSSTADLVGPDHVRRIPLAHKITFPLMALSATGRCIGLMWEPSPWSAAVFDSPDRTTWRPGHLFGLWAPGVGASRLENQTRAHTPRHLPANRWIHQRMALFGSPGETVVPAVQAYVRARGLPPAPTLPGGEAAATAILAAGWTQSGGFDWRGGWKHAVWPGSEFVPAADAVVYAASLAQRTTSFRDRLFLSFASWVGFARLVVEDPVFSSRISHAPLPMQNLILGRLPEYLLFRRNEALNLASTFDEGGVLRYRPPPGGRNFAETHPTDHANGHTAAALLRIMEAAALTCDPELVDRALSLIDIQTELYANTVPRGAQSWEIPLHAPDLYAAALLTGCYLLAYELTGRADLLAQAKYWAWTGIPFIYLNYQGPGIYGDYASTPVYGGTGWSDSIWIGKPVQWCGLAYRNWLLRLATHDVSGPWARVANGLTGSGLTQSQRWQDPALWGLLPDYLDLASQTVGGPAINPGSLQAGLPEYFGSGSYYGTARVTDEDWMIHVPGRLKRTWETGIGVGFTVDTWSLLPYVVLIANVWSPPDAVLIGPIGSEVGAMQRVPFTYAPVHGWLIIGPVRGDQQFVVSRFVSASQ